MTKDLHLLGLPVKDSVTGFSGIVTSIGYDLYGCIQAIVTPLLTAPGKLEDSRWFDTKRLVVESTVRVMDAPDFEVSAGKVEPKIGGPQEKPSNPRW